MTNRREKLPGARRGNDTTFTNDSHFFGLFGAHCDAGYFAFDATAICPAGPACFNETASWGPLLSRDTYYDVEATQSNLGPWDPANGPGTFPLGGFQTIVVHGAIDLAD